MFSSVTLGLSSIRLRRTEPSQASPDAVDDPLTAVLRNGARRLLAQAIEAEADAFLATMKGVQLPDGRERLVRHGHGPERLVQTGIGPVEVQRVHDFPAEHWDHLRTANPIESVFATVRHRTVRTKGALSQDTARLMVFKLIMAAAKTWRRLKGENQLPKVVAGVTFRNGVEVTDKADRRLITTSTQIPS